MRLRMDRRHPNDERREVGLGAVCRGPVAGPCSLDRLRIEPADITVEHDAPEELRTEAAPGQRRQRGGWIGVVFQHQCCAERRGCVGERLDIVAPRDELRPDMVVRIDDPHLLKFLPQAGDRIGHRWRSTDFTLRNILHAPPCR